MNGWMGADGDQMDPGHRIHKRLRHAKCLHHALGWAGGHGSHVPGRCAAVYVLQSDARQVVAEWEWTGGGGDRD